MSILNYQYALPIFLLGGALVTKLCLTLVTPQTVAHQAPLTMGFFQARTLQWAAMPSFRGSSGD